MSSIKHRTTGIDPRKIRHILQIGFVHHHNQISIGIRGRNLLARESMGTPRF